MISDKKLNYFNGLVVTRKMFEKHIKYYKKKYNVTTLKNIYNQRINLKNDINKTLVITFDDGYKENYNNALEILDKHKLKASFYLNSSTIGNNKMMWRDSIYYLLNNINEKQLRLFSINLLGKIYKKKDILKITKEMSFEKVNNSINFHWNNFFDFSQKELIKEKDIYLRKKDINYLIKNGHEIGIHSTDHKNITNLDTEKAIDEIMKSYNFIKGCFDYNPVSMSFPFGKKHYDEKFYSYLLSKSTLNYFLGINYNLLSNRDINSTILERLGMEDGRNFFVSFYLRPIIRIFK